VHLDGNHGDHLTATDDRLALHPRTADHAGGNADNEADPPSIRLRNPFWIKRLVNLCFDARSTAPLWVATAQGVNGCPLIQA
jgi:hypothetical protein